MEKMEYVYGKDKPTILTRRFIPQENENLNPAGQK